MPNSKNDEHLRLFRIHKKNLQQLQKRQANPATSYQPPPDLKGAMLRFMREDEVTRENLKLLGRISNARPQRPWADEQGFRVKSLRQSLWKRENANREEENIRLLQRIIDKKSEYKHTRTAKPKFKPRAMSSTDPRRGKQKGLVISCVFEGEVALAGEQVGMVAGLDREGGFSIVCEWGGEKGTIRMTREEGYRLLRDRCGGRAERLRDKLRIEEGRLVLAD